MEKLAGVLKIFIEKHLIPTIISTVGAITTLLLLPSDSWIVVKIGKTLFIILAFCIYFLGIQTIIQAAKLINKILSNIRESNYDNEQKEIENQKAIRRLNEFVDKLSPEDKSLLISFVKNGNKILIAYDPMTSYGRNNLLYNYNIINSSDYRGDVSFIDRKNYWLTEDLEMLINNGLSHSYGLKQYKIKDEFFNDFEMVYKINGKLGNF